MAAKSSENENNSKRTKSRKVLPSHGKVHQSGRGEVLAFGRGCLPRIPIFYIKEAGFCIRRWAFRFKAVRNGGLVKKRPNLQTIFHPKTQ